MTQKTKKAGILLFVLVVPAFVFLLLRYLTTPHFNVIKYYPIGTEKKVVNGKEIVDTVYHTISPFKFKSHLDKDFSSDELKGKLYVASFIFTRCQTICPRMTSQVKRIQEFYKNNSEVKLVSFTVDPYYDTPSVLKDYAKSYEVMDDKWIFLTGSKEEIYQLAKKDFKINALEDANNPEEFIHSDKLILVDWFGRIRGYYDGTNLKEVNRLQKEILVLFEQSDYEK